MLVVGIDPSLTNTGVVILDDKGELKSQKLFHSKPQPNRIKRIDKLLGDVFCFIIDNINHHAPILFGLEGYSYGSQHFAHQLGELGGILRYKLYISNWYNTVEYAPTMVKKFTTGKGNAKKDLILLNVFKKYGYETDSPDIADAYAIAKLRLAHYQIEKGIKALVNYLVYEREVLKKIIKE